MGVFYYILGIIVLVALSTSTLWFISSNPMPLPSGDLNLTVTGTVTYGLVSLGFSGNILAIYLVVRKIWKNLP